MNKNIIKLIGILGFALMVCSKNNTQSDVKGGFTLSSIDGEEISLESYKGKVVIVDFWATWCPPCRNEIPHLIELYNKYKDQGFIILGISLEDEQTLKNFRDEYRIPYLILLGTKEISKKYDVQAIPKTLFIDRKGKVRKIQVGFAPELAPEFDAFIDTLIKEK